MHAQILRPLALSAGFTLVTACLPGPATSTEGDTELTAAGSSTGATPTTGAATGSSTGEPTTAEPTTAEPGTGTTAEPSTGDASTGEPPSELCAQLGGPGEGGIQDLVDGFLGALLVDPRINGYFLNQDLDAGELRRTLTEQLGVIAGCPGARYSGRGMQEAHAGLKISQQDLLDFVADFQLALAVHQAVHPELGDDGRAELLAALSGLAPEVVEDPTGKLTIYQRVGRKPAIQALVGGPDAPDSFLGIVAADPAINGFFGGSDWTRLATCLTRQLAGIDGPVHYGAEVDSPGPGVDEGVAAASPCRDMLAAHEGLLDANSDPISFEDFATLVADLGAAMTAAKVTEPDQQAILAALAPLCDAIVAGNFERNKCPGSSKLEIVEVSGLQLPLADGAYDGSLASMVCHTFDVAADPDGVAYYGDLALTVGLDHVWVGDLTLKLVGPSGHVLTVFNRPGGPQLPDDGSGCCGDSSNLDKAFPLTFKNGGAFAPANMGKTLGTNGIICKDDFECEFKPEPGAGPGLDFTDFVGEPVEGAWKVCLGDSNPGDPGVLDALRLAFTRLRHDPKG